MCRSVHHSSFARYVFFLSMVVITVAFPAPASAQNSSSRSLSSQPNSDTQTGSQPDPNDLVTLEPGRPLERDLSGGQRHTYQIPLSAGQCMKVEIRDIGTDVGVNLQFPDGKITAIGDPIADRRKVKGVIEVAEFSGNYRVIVYASSRAATGRYLIRLVDVHPATQTDLDLQDARVAYRESRRLSAQSRWAQALPLMQHAFAVREKILGPDDPLVLETLAVLGGNYDHLGDYTTEEPLLLRTLATSQKIYGPDSIQAIQFTNEAAGFYRGKGDYLKAEQFDRRALALLESTHRMETPLAASTLESRANILYWMGDYAGASKFSQQSLLVWEKLLGPDSYHLTSSLSFSGQLAYDTGNIPRAQAMFERALSLSEKALGPDNVAVTGFANDLAMLYCTTGEYAKGEALYRRSLSVHQQKGAMSYPSVRETLFGLARCLAARGNVSDAIGFQLQASEIEEHYVSVNLAAGSQREKQAFLDHLSARSWRNISLHTQQAPHDSTALDLAVTTVLRRKGRVQDAMSGSLSALRQHLGPEDQKLLDQLNDLNSRLARLALSAPPKAATKQDQQMKDLEEQREGLEEEISRRSTGFYQSSKPVTLASVQAAIPEDAALIEFAIYRPFDPRARDNQEAYGKPRYVAYLLRNHGDVQWKELGEARAIDKAVDRLRSALRDPQRQDVHELARALDEKIMRPLRVLSGGANHLLISPDGQLDLIPFEALMDEQGHYLTEKYSITYLTAGRDLLRMQVVRRSKSAPLLIADPVFGEPTSLRASQSTRTNRRQNAVLAKRGSLPTGKNLSTVYFAPLAGTSQEIHAIQSLFPDAQVLTGTRASKSALQQADAPRILHIATHGFFLNDLGPESLYPRPVGAKNARAAHPAVSIENPLLRSGLALAGANLHKNGSEDGILTALEASNLNLWGTKLVTLSACETGVGEVKDGEGVYGLRRSFFLAGTETLVMSLWAISDQITREMMTTYYSGLQRGLGRGEALHQAQLAMLKRKSRRHPFYWASFIQSGEWANLDGHR